MIPVKSYTRKPIVVDAIRITEENMDEVSQWCNGKLEKDQEDKVYIFVEVPNAKYPRQSTGYVGDWILEMNSSFRVYTGTAFERFFDETGPGSLLNPFMD